MTDSGHQKCAAYGFNRTTIYKEIKAALQPAIARLIKAQGAEVFF